LSSKIQKLEIDWPNIRIWQKSNCKVDPWREHCTKISKPHKWNHRVYLMQTCAKVNYLESQVKIVLRKFIKKLFWKYSWFILIQSLNIQN